MSDMPPTKTAKAEDSSEFPMAVTYKISEY